MAAVSLAPADLAPFATIEAGKAQAMIDDALALAARVAPCILDDTFEHAAAAKAILRGAVLRWHDSAGGMVQYETSGPFSRSMDTRQSRKGMFWPSEIEQLQDLCREATASTGAFSITPNASASGHAPWCDLMFGGATCSCGYTLSGGVYPIYEA